MPKAATEERDFTAYAEKEPTDMHQRFADWIREVTGIDPKAYKDKDALFVQAIALGAWLRPTFQRSETNHDAWKESGRSVPGTSRKAAPKKAAAKKAAPVVEDVEEDDTEETPAPAKKVAKKAPAKAAPARVGGVKKAAPRKAGAGSTADAPF